MLVLRPVQQYYCLNICLLKLFIITDQNNFSDWEVSSENHLRKYIHRKQLASYYNIAVLLEEMLTA